jgi:hypothetical protein
MYRDRFDRVIDGLGVGAKGVQPPEVIIVLRTRARRTRAPSWLPSPAFGCRTPDEGSEFGAAVRHGVADAGSRCRRLNSHAGRHPLESRKQPGREGSQCRKHEKGRTGDVREKSAPRSNLLPEDHRRERRHDCDVGHAKDHHHGHQSPATPDAVKTVVEADSEIHSRASKARVSHQVSEWRATVSKAGSLDPSELIDARQGEDPGSEPCDECLRWSPHPRHEDDRGERDEAI